MKFRPCIDLHNGQVKQIVGGSLSDQSSNLITNFVSEHTPGFYAKQYQKDQLTGGHVIKLGPGNDEAAKEALQSWPQNLQLGGGVTDKNAKEWIENGAEAVIVTSYVFNNGEILLERLKKLVSLIGTERLVLDLSCRKKGDAYFIVTDRWQKFTNVQLTPATVNHLSKFCAEFLIHAVDVEGKNSGIDSQLLTLLANTQKVPTTYAGGVHNWDDIKKIKETGHNQIDFTVGSALDIFGGTGLKYQELVDANQNQFNTI